MCQCRINSLHWGWSSQPLIGNPYNGYINLYYWVDDHPLLYRNNGSWSTRSHTSAASPTAELRYRQGCRLSSVKSKGWVKDESPITNVTYIFLYFFLNISPRIWIVNPKCFVYGSMGKYMVNIVFSPPKLRSMDAALSIWSKFQTCMLLPKSKAIQWPPHDNANAPPQKAFIDILDDETKRFLFLCQAWWILRKANTQKVDKL